MTDKHTFKGNNLRAGKVSCNQKGNKTLNSQQIQQST